MSLQFLNSQNFVGWTLQQAVTGFSPTTNTGQLVNSTTFTVEEYGVNDLYIYGGSLAAGNTLTIDLTNLTDVFNQPLSLARAYGIQLRTSNAAIQFGPAATNPFTWFFGNSLSYLVVQADSDFALNTRSSYNVTGSAKNIYITNLSSTTAADIQLVIVGGTGVPGPTATPSATPFTTATPVPTPTPTPTPSLTYFVTPTVTPTPAPS